VAGMTFRRLAMRSIKNLLIFVLISIFVWVLPVRAEEISVTVSFTWFDDNVKTQGFYWQIFDRDEEGEYDYSSPTYIIPWIEGETGFSNEKEFVFDGSPGQIVKKYFIMRAVTASGVSSVDSNEGYYYFTIPPEAPYSYTIKIKIDTD
jgi:hypothetical protein